jgi:hypothetical protein
MWYVQQGVQRSNGSGSCLFAAFAVRVVALISPHQITIFPLPLFSPQSYVGGAILVGNGGHLDATSCSFKNNDVVRGECGSVLLLQSNMRLLPSSPIPSYAGRCWWCLWWCSVRAWISDHDQLRFFAKHGACRTAAGWSRVRVAVVHRWQRNGGEGEHEGSGVTCYTTNPPPPPPIGH